MKQIKIIKDNLPSNNSNKNSLTTIMIYKKEKRGLMKVKKIKLKKKLIKG